MNYLKPIVMVGLAAFAVVTNADQPSDDRRERFRPHGKVLEEAKSTLPQMESSRDGWHSRATEAPTGFDGLSNGFLVQGPPFESLDEENVVPLRSFNDNRFIFEEAETVADGLGPIYNAQSCRECHQNVVTGGASQIAEHRTGRLMGDEFFESLGGSLVHSRSTHPDINEVVTFEDSIRTFRISTNTLGAGFVEAIANSTLLDIQSRQPRFMRGIAVRVPILEAGSVVRIGRFGWKSQHASLESFSADAYLNEMGITSPLFPDENTSSGRNVGYGTPYDLLPDPEDDGIDIVAFADFMRASKAPSRGEIDQDVLMGERIFDDIGCDICHVPTIETAPIGTQINAGAFVVPEALGEKLIHPYSDFLLHDIGTGDGIPVLPLPEYANTTNKIRTAPLWALRTRNRLMHDGLTFTTREAIERHRGQAQYTSERFARLSAEEQALVFKFLESL